MYQMSWPCVGYQQPCNWEIMTSVWKLQQLFNIRYTIHIHYDWLFFFFYTTGLQHPIMQTSYMSDSRNHLLWLKPWANDSFISNGSKCHFSETEYWMSEHIISLWFEVTDGETSSLSIMTHYKQCVLVCDSHIHPHNKAEEAGATINTVAADNLQSL